MGTVHQLLLDLGKEGALKADVDRPVIEAAAAYLTAEDNETGYLYSGWAQAALPHKRLADDALWQVKNDRVTLVVQPGVRVVEDGPPVYVGVPYGSRARLILLYLQSEALRTGSREIELGRSLHAWLRRLSIPIGGKSMRDVRDQAERISRCRMSFEIKQGARTGLANQLILDSAMFEEDGGKKGLQFIETATLSQTFFEQLKKHPVPVEEAAVRQLANNSMALDVYCWLAYRLHSLTSPTPVSWRALYAQFGQGYGRIDNFCRKFRGILHLALAVYPEAQVKVEERGVLLNPSRPPVVGKGPRLALVPTRSLLKL
ncbi:replication protein RepA [Belnapia moabensis]|uniref:replication protein RepA n=1 Tax=Belnapia moabensis TaxID=365533 RepID=UPI0005B9DA32|nr:replication protein RepA [Belnapia moabensis]